MRQVRYKDLADSLRSRILDGEYAPAAVLPSESELGRDHGVSRVTVRKALETLRDEGLVDSRQGFGWFVAARPLRQSLVRLGTIEEQLSASGVASERRVLEFGFVAVSDRVSAVLDAPEALRVLRLNLADGIPFALVTVWCPPDLGAELSRADVERESFMGLLPVDLAGATQSIGASAAGDDDARLLGVPAGAPVLRVERVARDVSGRAVLMAEHLFPAHLTEYVVELPHGPESLAPDGVRLVG